MFLADVDSHTSARSAESSPAPSSRLPLVGDALVKAALAALAGFVLCLGLALVVWAVTPSSGDSPKALVQAGIAAFCAAAGMTLRIGAAELTLPPLMLTAVIVALLIAVVGRGRGEERGVEQELTFIGSATASFALTVTVVGVLAGGHAVDAQQWWRPTLLAGLVFGTAMLVRGTACREWLYDRLPRWAPVSLRMGSAGVMVLFGGGVLTLIVGLIRTFSDASTVQTLAAPGAAGGFGMFVLGLAYLPNAAVAAAGYSTGVGFTVGAGTYTPFGSSPVELPAVSLLTAVPDSHTVSRTALLVLLVPVVAGVVIGFGVIRRLPVRSDRLFAVGGAALFAAVVTAVVAEMASGGVTGGEWSSSGAPPLLFGAAAGVLFGAVGATVVAVAPGRAATDVVDAEVVDDEDQSDEDPADEVVDDGDPADEGLSDQDQVDEDQVDEDESDEERAEVAAEVEAAAADHGGTLDQSGAPALRDEDVIADEYDDADIALVTELRPQRRPRRAG